MKKSDRFPPGPPGFALRFVSLMLLVAVVVAAAESTTTEPFPTSKISFSQDTGAKLFVTNCAPCHQVTGLGLGELYPPLAGSEWVTGSELRLMRVILGGLTGEIEVQGEMFKGAMPGWGPLLNDTQAAAVATYIRSSWGNKAAPVTAATSARVRKEQGSRTTPWTDAELRKAGGL